eukprot:SM000020S06069  [mRNA]  locus=s20:861409:864749:- [translate_table: standard]
MPPAAAGYGDRFIPARSASGLATAFVLGEAHSPPSPAAPPGGPTFLRPPPATGDCDGHAAYGRLLRTELFGAEGGGGSSSSTGLAPPVTPERDGAGLRRASGSVGLRGSPASPVFRFQLNTTPGGAPSSSSASGAVPSPYSLSPIGSDLNPSSSNPPRQHQRRIARSPFKVLDAPALQDDFYLNLVDWSAQNLLAVGLGSCIYLWSACTSRVTKLCDLGPSDSVCSVSWTQRGTYLAVGTNLGEAQIWDVAKGDKLRTMGGHRTRVGALAWNSHILSSGSRDRSILQRDVRAPGDYVSKLVGHKSEVCGLKWSPDDRELASGGNDNQLLVWNFHSTQPVIRWSDHVAAVKAIAWSPHQHGLLASGGGTADRCIRFWSTINSTLIGAVDTSSQVCNLAWSGNVNELVSTHGYSQNQVVVWKYPTMSKLATLTGHTMRVLYLAIAPDGQTIVTGAGDETLRFWNIFPSAKTQGRTLDSGFLGRDRSFIR